MNPNDLLKTAFKVMGNAYAPYSHYKVGAALLCEDGRVFSGCNVENSSYGLTICAERTAFFSAIAQGETGFTALAIISSDAPAPFPCGACRQVLSEFCQPDFPIYIASASEPTQFTETTLGELLPQSFSLNPGNKYD